MPLSAPPSRPRLRPDLYSACLTGLSLLLSTLLWLLAPMAEARPREQLPLGVARLSYPARMESEILATLALSASKPGAVLRRLKPVGVQNPQIDFRDPGPRGGPWYRLDGTVSVGPISMKTFLAGDVTLRDAVPCKSGQPLGYLFKLSFESSDAWIQENADAVVGLVCAETQTGQTEISLQGFMIEGPDFGGTRGRRLKSLLADQLEPLLRAMLPLPQ